jgi:hypothetical protein
VVTAEAELPEASVVPVDVAELSLAPLDSLELSRAAVDVPDELDLWVTLLLVAARFSALATSAGSCPEASCT